MLTSTPKIGDALLHPKFGRGVVTGVKLFGYATLVMKFEKPHGTKEVLIMFAKERMSYADTI